MHNSNQFKIFVNTSADEKAGILQFLQYNNIIQLMISTYYMEMVQKKN